MIIFFAETIGVSGQDDFTVIEENDLVENLFDIGDEVGRDKKGRAFSEVAKDGVEDVVAGSRIDATKWLIEDIKFGFSGHDKDKLELFLHTFRHLEDFHRRVEVEIGKKPLGLFAVEVFIKGLEQVEIVFYCCVFVEIGTFGKIGNVRLRIDTKRFAFEMDFSVVGNEEIVYEFD